MKYQVCLQGVRKYPVFLTSRTNGLIHDALAQTVAVDLASQMIFGSEAELMAYIQRCHEEMVTKKPY